MAAPQSFGWTPNLTVTLTDWRGDRSVEMTLGRKRPKKKPHADDGEVLALLLGDGEVWE